MQSLGDLFANNKVVGLAILALTIVIVVVAVLVLARLAFGRRLTATGSSRSRQPRLGVVDAFDLDRQRQLVIVRRDNVEHLLLIGGPNDLVVERAIVRSGTAMAGPAVAREKDAGSASSSAAPVIGLPPSVQQAGPSLPPVDDPHSVPAVAQPPRTPAVALPPPSIPRPAPSSSAPPPRPASPFPPRPPASQSPSGSTPPKPVLPVPPRPPSTPTPRPLTTPLRPAPAAGLAVPLPPRPVSDAKKSEEVERAAPAPEQTEGAGGPRAAPAPVVAPDVVVSADEPAPPAPRVQIDNPRTETKIPSRTPPPRPAPIPPRQAAVAGQVPPVRSLDALESLEEEMAKLLGRPAPPADKT